MKLSFSPAQVEQFRRDAKRIKQQENIPLSAAQNRIAMSEGFQNWSLLAKAEQKPLSTPKRVSPPKERYYLHGDLSAVRANEYFCVRCDTFEPADHFSQHEENGKRFLWSLSRWEGSAGSEKFFRSKTTVNLFNESAIAERAAREASRSAFHRWIEQQKGRDDPIGDLATDIMGDKKFPIACDDKAAVQDYIESRATASEVVDAFLEAWSEFEAETRSTA